MTARLEIWAPDGIPEVVPGDDVAALLVATGVDLRDGDVVVVTSKVVSKAEGRLVPGEREDHLDAETVRVVAERGRTRIVQTRHGFVMAAAGIDASNVPAGLVALLPIDPDRSARQLRNRLLELAGVEVAVVVTDTAGRPWRNGVVDMAIGAAGIEVLLDLRGLHDAAGHHLEATVVAVADELASAADLVKGKLAGRPVAVVRGWTPVAPPVDEGAKPLVRLESEDMFALGSREAARAAVTVRPDTAAFSATAVDEASMRRGLAAAGPTVHWAPMAAGTDAAAPVLVAACVDGPKDDPATLLAAGAAIERAVAALAVEGLGSHLGAPGGEAVLDLPAGRWAVAVLAIGHPAG